MSNGVPGLIVTLLLQWVLGLGVMATIRSTLPRSIILPTALLLGSFLHTVIVVALDLAGVGLTAFSVTAGLSIAALVAHASWPRARQFYRALVVRPTITFRMYDAASYAIALYLVYVALWAAWYWPVTPFDAMAGIDLMARQSVVDGTLNNSIFSDPALAGRLSNQPFYAPFAMLQQVIYRLMGWPFGQLWLGVTALCYYWLMWALFRRYAHPFIANILALLLIMVPEVHGYTYLLQTDFLNAVYMSAGIILLGISVESKNVSQTVLAALFFAAACWSRSETILLVVIGLGATFPFIQKSLGLKGALKAIAMTITACSVVFALWHVVYFYAVFPTHPDTAAELAGFDVVRLADVLSTSFTDVFSDLGLWGWTMPLFAIVLIACVVRYRRLGDLWTFIWILAIIVGLEIVGTMFASAVVQQTLRRGVFKLIPLMYLFIARTPIVEAASARLRTWEASSAAS